MLQVAGDHSRTIGGMWRVSVVTVVFAAALAVAIPASQAGSVGVSVSSTSGVTFVAGSGETNALYLRHVQLRGLVFTDSGANLTAGAGCVSLGPNSAECDYRPNIDAYLGDKDDTAWVTWIGLHKSGPGAETTASLRPRTVSGRSRTARLAMITLRSWARAVSSLTAARATMSSMYSPSADKALDSAGMVETSSSSTTTFRVGIGPAIARRRQRQ